MTKIEEAVHVPAHYLMMVIAVVLVLLTYVFTRKCFCTVVIIVPAVFLFFRDVHEKKNEKKWLYFWLLFSFLTMFAPLLNRIKYYCIVKVVVCYFFMIFDKEGYLEKGFKYIEEGLNAAVTKYMSYCEKRD